MELSCYILTERAYDSQGRCRLMLFGISDNGPVEIHVSSWRPVFFLPRASQLPPGIQLEERRQVDLQSMEKTPVDALYFSSLNHYFNGRDMIRQTGLVPLESDIRTEERYLMERFIFRNAVIIGEPEIREQVNPHNPMELRNKRYIFHNPKIIPGEYSPSFRCLSLDIETGENNVLYCIGMHGSDLTGEESGSPPPEDQENSELREVIMIDSGGSISEEEWGRYTPVNNERELIDCFCSRVREYDPDLLIGWNVIGFDLQILLERAEAAGTTLKIGRSSFSPRVFRKQSGMNSAEIDGRIVLDGPQILRGGFFTFSDYSLETVASELLGRGKDIRPNEDKVAEIRRRFREDKKALAFYNFEDCKLVTEVFGKTGIITQYTTRSITTGMRLDRVSMSVASFDYFILPRFHRAGFVAPDVQDIHPRGHAAGGFVFTTEPGLYSHVVVLDFKSLYPSIIRTFKIDPLSLLQNDINSLDTPEGISFSRTEHILPEYVGELLSRRAEAKKAGDANLSQAVKILMNSYYGVMGTPGCRFYHPDLPTAITGTGQWILKNTAEFLRRKGYLVLYGDTDSVFVQLKEEDIPKADTAASALVDSVNSYFSELITEQYHLESYLELEYEKHYSRFFLPPMRGMTGGTGSSEGARKRYAGKLSGSGELELKGLEYVRSDWTDIAKEFQYELFHRIFNGEKEEVIQWIKDFVQEIKDGVHDGKLVYKRRLTKPASAYEKNVPPHVKAARLLDPEDKKHIRRVKYLITSLGPVPVEHHPEQIDYNHYIEKQIKPLADGVLFILGTGFDEIIEGRQLELF